MKRKARDVNIEDAKDIEGNLANRQKQEAKNRILCPYLDTIDRHVLDFDFEKVCSVTLSNQNVYGCLVCGKYFQGRGPKTAAHTHSVQSGHYVFINLESGKIYCLPDGYLVEDSSLDDIKYNLRPSFTKQEVETLSKNTTLATDIFGQSYLPGFIGMNQLNKTDYVNVVVHMLCRVRPLREFFLVRENYFDSTSKVVQTFGALVCKIFSSRKFKGSVSPHELVQAISIASKKRFQIGTQSDCIHFLAWFLNELHKGLGGTSKKGSSIIHQCFQGLIEVTTTTTSSSSSKMHKSHENSASKIEKAVVPFLFLVLDLPESPLFKDSFDGKSLIPQIALGEVLAKFDGETVTDVLKPGKLEKKTYRITKLPNFMLLNMKRFKKNNWYYEKNPTIVNFPIKDLDLGKYLRVSTKDKATNLEENLRTIHTKSVKELKELCRQYGINSIEKSDMTSQLTKRLENELETRNKTENPVSDEAQVIKYDLLANICHESASLDQKESRVNPLINGSYRVHVRNEANDQWYEIQDLHVREIMPQQISVSESYILLFERKG